MSEDPTERRREKRLRALKGGKIVFNQRHSVITCIIRDLSAHGAKLQLASSAGVPDRFDLVFDADNSSHPCRAAWKTETQVGVEFISTPPDAA